MTRITPVIPVIPVCFFAVYAIVGERMQWPFETSRLYERVVQNIEASVLEGTLRLGDKLPSERELCDQFGVSRTVIREAIRALREKGLVNIQPGRGTFITNDTSAAMRQSFGLMVRVGQEGTQKDLIQIRAILEPEIAALAARMAVEEEIAAMQQAVDEMDGAVHNADQFIRADQEFHLLLARATKNGLIPMLIDPIVDLLWEQRKRIFLVEGGAQRGQYHHKRILQAVIDHQPAEARVFMQEHMKQVGTDSGMIDILDL